MSMATESALADALAGSPATAREPKYYRVKQQLLGMMASLGPGSAVPPERELAVEFETSRTTVRQALTELVVEGRLERIQGRGTFVAKPKVAQILQLTSYTQDMQAQGLAPTSRLLSIGPVAADRDLAVRLNLRAGARVVRLERLRLANSEPMAVEVNHLAARRFPGLRKHLEKSGSLYSTLAQVYGVRLAEAEETIETVLCPPREAEILGTDAGSPMLLLSRHSWDTEGNPVEYVRSIYRGDRYKFVTKLRPPSLE
jgi:GntR family transcriptional regulator